MTPRPRLRRPRSRSLWRSRSRTSGLGLAASPAAALASAACPASPRSPSAASRYPSLQHLRLKALRRPVESALAASIGVEDDPFDGGSVASQPGSGSEGVEAQLGAEVVGDRPAQQAP